MSRLVKNPRRINKSMANSIYEQTGVIPAIGSGIMLIFSELIFFKFSADKIEIPGQVSTFIQVLVSSFLSPYNCIICNILRPFMVL